MIKNLAISNFADYLRLWHENYEPDFDRFGQHPYILRSSVREWGTQRRVILRGRSLNTLIIQDKEGERYI